MFPPIGASPRSLTRIPLRYWFFRYSVAFARSRIFRFICLPVPTSFSRWRMFKEERQVRAEEPDIDLVVDCVFLFRVSRKMRETAKPTTTFRGYPCATSTFLNMSRGGGTGLPPLPANEGLRARAGEKEKERKKEKGNTQGNIAGARRRRRLAAPRRPPRELDAFNTPPRYVRRVSNLTTLAHHPFGFA